MSRGVKDLRELICVSRLTIRESDDELQFSDDEGRMSRMSVLGQKFEVLSLESGTDSRQSSAHSRAAVLGTPDSGIGTNGHTPLATEGDGSQQPIAAAVAPFVPKPPTDNGRPKSSRKRRKKKKPPNTNVSHDDLLTMHELPKLVPLPPVAIGPGGLRPSSSSSESASSEQTAISHSSAGVRRPGGSTGPRMGPVRRHGNFDEMLRYLDATVVGECLQTANESVQNLAHWIHHKDNYVQFAHFWLRDFSDVRKREILQLEHSIILDHLELSFASGKEAGKVNHRDLVDFLSAIFREYPARMLSSKGSHMFLDYLDILTSERTKSYKTLLSDVKCSTRNRQYAQLVLAARCFALVSVWNAVLNFYRTLVRDVRPVTASLPDMSKLRPSNQRMYLAVR